MKSIFRGFVRTLLAGAALASAPAVALAEGAPPPTRAAELYHQATRLYAGRKLAEAEPLYREAWALQKSYEIASNYGALELELGNPRLAAELLGRAVAEFPVRGRLDERAALEARYAAARRRIGALRMKVSRPGAEVLVDGRSVGFSPLASEVLVDPGEHVLEAKLAGYSDARLSLAVRNGSTFNVTLPLNPPPQPRKRSLVPVIVGASVGVAAAVVGVALVGLAEGKRRDAAALHDSIQASDGSCAGWSAACDQLHAATRRADTLGNAGISLLGVAGAAALGTATYVLWPTLRPGGRRSDVRASLGIGPGGGAAVITGSF